MFVFTALKSFFFPSAKKILSFIFLCLLVPTTFYAQPNTWIPKANLPIAGRERMVGISINGMGYMGTGDDGTNFFRDWWQYDPTANSWTQEADVGDPVLPQSTLRNRAVGLSINGKGYVGMGYDGSVALTRWYEYDPAANTWTEKAMYGGGVTMSAAGFTIGNKGYVGTGYTGSSPKNDFWQYDPVADAWTQMANYGGSPRYDAVGFSIGNYGYMGCGWAGTYVKDFWRYNPLTNKWIQIPDYSPNANDGRTFAFGFSIGGKGYVGGGSSGGTAARADFREYNPILNSWAQLDSIPVARYGASSFVIGNTAYAGTGNSGSTLLNDLWQYTPAPLSQNIFQRRFGGTNSDADTTTNFSFASPTTDGGYIIASATKSFGNGNSDMYLIKTNNLGDTLWTKTYGTTADEIASSVRQTADGGYIIAGTSIVTGNSDLLVLKLNSAGAVQWTKGTPGAPGIQRANYATEIPGGGYLVTGRGDGASTLGACLIKLNTAGGTVWSNSYGRSTGSVDEGFYVEPTSLGYYVVSGNTQSGLNNDAYIVIANSSGSSLFAYDVGSASNEIRTVVKETPDGGYIICGSTNTSPGHGGYDIFMIKTNASASPDPGWPKLFGGANDDFARSIVITPEGDYVVGGYTKSAGAGGKDAFMMKISSGGNMLWGKAYGGSLDDSGNSLSQTGDGGFVLSGQTFSFSAGASDVYVIKTDSMGNSGCHETSFSFFPMVPSLTYTTCIPLSSSPPISSALVAQKPAYTLVDKLCTSCTFQLGKNKTNVKCFGDNSGTALAAPLTGAFPYTYFWSNGATTSAVSGLTAGIYTVTVTDNNSCSATDTITIYQPSSPIILTIFAGTNICIGNSATIGAGASGGTPPFSYSWSPSAEVSCASCQNTVATPTVTGTTTYIISVADSNLCVKKDSVHVIVNSLPSVNAGPDQTICYGSNTTLNATGAAAYSWIPSPSLSNPTIANPTVNPISTTTYVVTGTNSAGCSNTDNVVVNIIPSPTVNITYTGPGTICSGTSVALAATTNGNSYSWSTGATTSSINDVPPITTNYSVSASIGACAGTATLTINVVPTPTVNISSSSGTICAGNSAVLAGTGTGNYLWSNGSTATSITVSPSVTTIYSLTVTATGNLPCYDTDTYTLSVGSSAPAVTVTSTYATICTGILNNTTLTASSSGASSYSWSPATNLSCPTCSNPIANPQSSITYSVVVTNTSGCTGMDTIHVNVISNPYSSPFVNPASAVYCLGDSILPFTVKNPIGVIVWTGATGNVLSYGYNDSTYQPPPNLPLGTTIGWVTQGTLGCLVDPSGISLTINPLPVANAGADITICAGHTAQLNASGGGNYLWSPGTYMNNTTSANPSATPDSTISYQVLVTDANNCKARDSITVYIEMNDSCGIHIYNVLTPNGDNNNDTWWIDGITSFPDNVVDIFNRWGDKVWGASHYDNKKTVWQGQNAQGQPLPAGTYYYVIDIKAQRRSGWVELLR